MLVWTAVVWVFKMPNYILPYPVAVAKDLWAQGAFLIGHMWVTLYSTLLGFAIAIIAGAFAAILIVSSKTMERAFMPLMVFAQTFPKIAIAPLFVIWFGFGIIPKVVVATLICFFPIIINTSVGLASVENDMVDLIRSMAATKWQVFTKVRIPNALPYFFSALKISITLALIGAIVGEFVASDEGLGYLILVYEANLMTSNLFATMTVLVLMGALLFYMIIGIENIFLPWQRAKQELGTTVSVTA
jgi:NitT/TauT family transport system permease protein